MSDRTNVTLMPSEDDEPWRRMSDDDLRAYILDCLGLTARAILHTAGVMRYAQTEREMNLSDMAQRFPLVRLLQQVASNTLLPELVERLYVSDKRRLKRLALLPVTDQRKYLDGGMVELVVYDAAGGKTKKMASPLEMSSDQLEQAFEGSKVRGESAQRLFIDDRRTKAMRKKQRETSGGYPIDRETKTVRVGSHVLPLALLKQFVRDLEQGDS